VSVYLFLKALHVCAAVCWFAGLSCLARLLAPKAWKPKDHVDGQSPWLGVIQTCFSRSTVFGFLTVISGLVLWLEGVAPGGWLHVKMLLIGLMIAFHIRIGRVLGRISRDRLALGVRWFGMALPLGLGAIFLAILKPF